MGRFSAVAMTIKEKIEKNLEILRNQINKHPLSRKAPKSRHQGAEHRRCGIKSARNRVRRVQAMSLKMSEEERRKTIRDNLTKQGIWRFD